MAALDVTSVWLPYVPRIVANEVGRDGARVCIGRERRISGEVLFADISGFTAMSEALGKTGRAGTEELSGIVNGCFATLIGIAQSHGGDVAKFGGDAMTVLFVPDGSRRAIACAIEMQAAMAAFRGVETRAGAYDLALKIGVARGRLFVTTVGSPQTQLEYVVAGGALQAAATAQGHGAPGEVVLHQSIASDVSAGRVESRAAGYVVLKEAVRLPPAVGPLTVDESLGGWHGELALFLHPRIRERLAVGLPEFVAEHRAVTVVFVGFDGFDYDGDRTVADALQRYFQRVLAVLARYDASLVEIDVADKGSVFIVALGAPVAHEDDAERALLCARELLALAPDSTTIGVNTGLAFCGYVGSPVRRSYAIFGDTVNTAARVLTASRAGQVLATAATRDRAGGRFAWGEPGTVVAKGKMDEIRVAPVLGAGDPAHMPARRGRLVGRTDELAEARAAIEAATDGRGRVLAVAGEPGIGKSSLAAETARIARARGVTVCFGAAESFGASMSHTVWRRIWRDFFGLEPSLPAATAISRLEHQLAEIDPRLAARAPLLGSVVGFPFRDNELTARLSPELRLASLHSLLLDCLLQRASRTPLLLVLEDCHWIDELSQELLELIARNVSHAAVLLLVLHRSDVNPIAAVEAFAHVRTLQLTRLGDEEARELIRARPAGADVPERLVDTIAAKAAGNPFYIEELLNFVHERDASDVDALELPATINNVVLARVDRLGERAGGVLRVASAIGRAFPAHWTWGSYPEVGLPADIRSDLAMTTQLGLTELDAPEPNLAYAFRHAVLHEAVYGSLAYATRSSIHERVGCFVEKLHAADPEPVLDVLAHHFDRGIDQAKRRRYLLAAGDAAKDRYANEAAISYFERLAVLVEGIERSAVLRRLGEVEQIVGRWGEATTHYRNAIALAAEAGADRERAAAESALGNLLSYTEALPEALDLLQRALATFEALNDTRGIGRTLENLSQLYYQQGKHAGGLACGERHRAIAAADGDTAGVSNALWDQARHRWRMGDERGAASDFEASLMLAEDLCDTRMIAFAANDLAGLCVQRGDLGAALKHLRRAYEAAREAGAEHWAMIAIGNAGEINRAHGDYEAAYAHYEYAIRRAMELGDLGSALSLVGNAGIVAAANGDVGEAAVLLESAVGMARRVGAEPRLSEFLTHLAELRSGEPDEAQRLNEEALGLALRLGDAEGRFHSRVLSARLTAARGNERLAREMLEHLLEDDLGKPERAAAFYELWRLDRTNETTRTAAADLYERLLATAPGAENRRRIAELTGREPPPPPPLSPIVDDSARGSGGLPAIVAMLDELLARAHALPT